MQRSYSTAFVYDWMFEVAKDLGCKYIGRDNNAFAVFAKAITRDMAVASCSGHHAGHALGSPVSLNKVVKFC